MKKPVGLFEWSEARCLLICGTLHLYQQERAATPRDEKWSRRRRNCSASVPIDLHINGQLDSRSKHVYSTVQEISFGLWSSFPHSWNGPEMDFYMTHSFILRFKTMHNYGHLLVHVWQRRGALSRECFVVCCVLPFPFSLPITHAHCKSSFPMKWSTPLASSRLRYLLAAAYKQMR